MKQQFKFREMINIVWEDGIQQADIRSEAYPQRLCSIAKAPDCVFYRGNIACINQNHSIAVIGSRRVSESGRALAYRIGYALGTRGINVVNGLALGCDTYALYGALAAGGTCVAVMPCGLEQIVPHSNVFLAKKLLSKRRVSGQRISALNACTAVSVCGKRPHSKRNQRWCARDRGGK